MTVYLGEPGYPKPRSVRLPAIDHICRLAGTLAALNTCSGDTDWPTDTVLVTYQRGGEVVVAYTTRAQLEEEPTCS